MNAREIAVYVLINIFKEKSYNNIMLKKVFDEHKNIDSQNKAFATELVNGTIRNVIYIDYVINKFSNTNTKKMKPVILNVIRISVYQLLFMEKVPVSAVCNEAVKIVKKKKFSGLSGFVNAIIRNISKNLDAIPMPNKTNKVNFLATKYSYQHWTIEKFLNQFDFETVERMLKANMLNPKISICVNTNKIDKNSLEKILLEEGMTVEDSFIDNNLYISKTKNIAESKAFKDGFFHIMDTSSMIAVDVLDPKQGETIIDVCSAPGGKSFYLSYKMKNSGKIISRDIHNHKIQLIKDSTYRLGIKNIKPELKDATKFYKEDEQIADKLIIDAPCSGFGIVRKKPDIKYTKTSEDIKTLSQIQKDILYSSYKYVKKGGIILYSTCTLFNEENIDNVKWFCKEFDFSLCPINLPYNLNIDTLNDGYINILPHMFNTDGFFMAKLKRNN